MHGNKGGNACVGGFIYLFIFNGLHKNILLLVSWINTVKYLIFFFKSLLLLYFYLCVHGTMYLRLQQALRLAFTRLLA